MEGEFAPVDASRMATRVSRPSFNLKGLRIGGKRGKLLIGVVVFLLLLAVVKIALGGDTAPKAVAPAPAPAPAPAAATPAAQAEASISDVRKAFGKAGLALSPAHGVKTCVHAKGCKTVLVHVAPKKAGRTLVYVFASPVKAKGARLAGTREGRLVVVLEGAKVRVKNAKRVRSVLASLAG